MREEFIQWQWGCLIGLFPHKQNSPLNHNICPVKKIIIFVLLKKLNKYFALLLLAVFSLAILPTHTLHGWFADHEDTEHNFCEKYHSHLGVHVEKTHTHCEILNINTPVYDSPSLPLFNKVEAVILSEISTVYKSFLPSQASLNIPARGPPACA